MATDALTGDADVWSANRVSTGPMYIQCRSMNIETQVEKWGNSLAVRIPREVVKEAGLEEGDRLSLAMGEDGSIVLRSHRRKYSLDLLVAGITAKNRHRETDWGAAQGKEAR